MKRDLKFENLALQEALTTSQAQNRIERAHYEADILEAEEERDHARKQNKIIGICSAVSSIAIAISHFLAAEKAESIISSQSAHIVDLAERINSLNKIAINDPQEKEHKIVELSQRLERVQSKHNKVTTPHDAPPPHEHELLLHGSYAEKVAILKTILGKDYVQTVENLNVRTVRHTERSQELSITGSHPYLEAKEVVQYIQGFPSDWVNGKVAKIVIHQETYGKKISILRDGDTVGEFDTENDSVHIYGATIGETNLTQFDRTVSHEVAHGNDWIRNSELTTPERIDLLSKIVARLLSKDRFVSSYVESIQAPDKETIISHQCEEYFAEIASAFFSNPTELHHKDYLIIHELVMKKNALFDIEAEKRKRVRSFNSYREL
jgi:hypothetical protein